MSRENAPIRVARISRTVKGRTYVSTLLRRTYREGGKVRNETVASLTGLPDETIDLIERSLKGEKLIGANSTFECIRSLSHGHVAASLGALRRLDLETLVASRRSRERDLVTAMIVSRIFEERPFSKLALARGLAEDTRWSTLGEILGVTSATEDELYEAMDWLLARQERIEKKLAKRHLMGSTLVLYDVTVTYFEGHACPLAKRTGRRGAVKGKLHILIGLLCDSEGRPIGVEVFEGNKGDPATLANQIEKIIERFKIDRMIIVGDRGLITQARIDDELREVQGLSWITALRAPTIKKLVEQGAVSRTLFDTRNLAEITSEDFPGERLIVCFNPMLAARRAQKREEMLKATEQVLQEIVHATMREKRRLRGKDCIGVRVGKHVNRYKMAKHFKLEINEDSFGFQRNEGSITKEAALDGIYIIRTDVPENEMDASAAVRTYKSLSRVERAFRCLKTMNLNVRPIYHRLEKRVRAHVFLCMLAYYVTWHMMQSLSPILFEEDDPEGAEELRDSPVDLAVPSLSAQEKASRKHNKEGYPVHSFTTLMKDLGTIVKNTMCLKGVDVGQTFTLVTTPSPLQHKAFDLLGVPVPT